MWKQLLPPSWRDTVVRDLEDEARRRQRGALWVVGQTLLVAVRLRPVITGDAVVSDFRYAMRSLWRSKTFAAGAVLTFALGIGVNVAVFTVVDRMMLRSLPYGESEQLVALVQVDPETQERYGTLDADDVLTVMERHSGIDGLAVVDEASRYRLRPDEPTSLLINEGSANLISVLGVKLILGRHLAAEDVRAQRRGVVISFASWQTHFGGRPDVIGQHLWSRGESVPVVGVLPSGFLTPPSVTTSRSDGVGINLAALRRPYPPNVRETPPIIRLKVGVSRVSAETEVNGLLATPSRPRVFRLLPMREFMFGAYAPYAWVVILAATLVLLMCCANLASLMLVRARSREAITILQLALGASRGRLIRGAVVESLCLAGAGSAVALLVVTWTQGALRGFVPFVFQLYAVEPTDGRVLFWALCVTVICALIAGVGPVLRTTGASRVGAFPGSGQRVVHTRSGGAVLMAEALIGVLLVSGAAVTGRSLLGLVNADLGYEERGLHFVSVQYPTYLADASIRFRDYGEVLTTLRQTPGILSAAAADVLPITAAGAMTKFGEDVKVWSVTDQFFSTVGIPVITGRTFTEREVATAAPVGLLSELGLRRTWPTVTPAAAIGRILRTEDNAPIEIIGVVGDVRSSGAAAHAASLYLPIRVEGFRVLRYVARTQAGASVPVGEVLRRLETVGNQAEMVATPVTSRLAEGLRDQRFRATLFGAFALVGLVLACVGLYAVTAFEVRLRRAEMGVRLALGATPSDIQRVVLGGTLRPLLTGVIVGVFLAWWGGTFLQSFLHKVDARDLATLALAAGALVVAGLLASWLPAREAGRVDPAIVLRSE